MEKIKAELHNDTISVRKKLIVEEGNLVKLVRWHPKWYVWLPFTSFTTTMFPHYET